MENHTGPWVKQRIVLSRSLNQTFFQRWPDWHFFCLWDCGMWGFCYNSAGFLFLDLWWVGCAVIGGSESCLICLSVGSILVPLLRVEHNAEGDFICPDVLRPHHWTMSSNKFYAMPFFSGGKACSCFHCLRMLHASMEHSVRQLFCVRNYNQRCSTNKRALTVENVTVEQRSCAAMDGPTVRRRGI